MQNLTTLWCRRVELGRVHAKLGHRSEALKQLELALTLDVEDINAYLQREDVPPILKSLKRRRWGLPALQSAPEEASPETSGQEASSPEGWAPRPSHAQGFPSMCEHANPYGPAIHSRGGSFELHEGSHREGTDRERTLRIRRDVLSTAEVP